MTIETEASKLPAETIGVHKRLLLNAFRRGLAESPAKIVRFEDARKDDQGFWMFAGYATHAKFLAGRYLSELDETLGFAKEASVKEGALVFLAQEIPQSTDDFKLAGLTHMPGGAYWSDERAKTEKNFPPASNPVKQFILTKPLRARLTHVLRPGDKITFQRSDYGAPEV